MAARTDTYRRVSRRSLFLAIAAVMLLAHAVGIRPAAAQVDGTTYTSPQFGYIVTWDESWFVVDEQSMPGVWDFLSITNGITTLAMFGEANTYPSFEAGLASYIAGFNSDPNVSEFTPMRDEDGNVIRETTGSGARAAFTCTYSVAEDVSLPVAALMEVRALDDGSVLFGYIASMALKDFENQRSFDGVTLPGDEPTPGPNRDANGEPAPVFVSGEWRIAVSQVVRNRAFPDLGLKGRSDREWLVLILDVTNWTDQSQLLSARDLRIDFGGDKPAKVARKVLAPLAEQLGTTAFYPDLTLTLEPEQTIRIALAFLVPADSAEIAVVHGDETIPVGDLARPAVDEAALSASVTPPEVTTGALVSASNGYTVRVLADAQPLPGASFRMLGVAPEADDPRTDSPAELLLDSLVPGVVLIEEDSSINSGDVPARYIWLVNVDGTRSMLNHRLIAEGLAEADTLPAAARFGRWLEAVDQDTVAGGSGVWRGCANRCRSYTTDRTAQMSFVAASAVLWK
jgi:hypothetical protein